MRRRLALKVALALGALLAGHASGAPLAARPALAAGPTAAPLHPAPLRAAPIERTSPPNKPLGVKLAGRPAQQAIVEWTVPDQSSGREIQRWLVRACPAVPGNPSAPCQPLPGPAAGQASGATMRAEIPAHVAYIGSQAPVNGVEICAVNAVGTSCADRLAVQFGPGITPAQGPGGPTGIKPAGTIGMAQQGGGPTGVKPAGTVGIRTAPATVPGLQPLKPGGGSAPSVTQNRPPSGGIAVRSAPPTSLQPQTGGAPPARGGIAVATAPRSPVSALTRAPEPIVVAAASLRFAAQAASAPQPISVNAPSLDFKASGAPAPKDITVSVSALQFSAKPASTRLGSKTLTTLALTKNTISIDAAPLRFQAAAAAPIQPIVVNASGLAFKANAASPPAPISVNAPSLKLTATSPNRRIR